jgi:cytidine deaminase
MGSRKVILSFDLTEFDSGEHLSKADAELLAAARKATQYSYAPYSKFNVGAAALLSDGRIVTGTNQENASFPAGICAERVLMAAVISQYHPHHILAMAISYKPEQAASDHPISPCGVCRQVLSEYETRFGSFKVILSGLEGKVIVLDKATNLLPLAFGSEELL